MLKALHTVFFKEVTSPVPIVTDQVPKPPAKSQPKTKPSAEQRAYMRELARRGGKASAAARKKREPHEALKNAERLESAEPPKA